MNTKSTKMQGTAQKEVCELLVPLMPARLNYPENPNNPQIICQKQAKHSILFDP